MVRSPAVIILAGLASCSPASDSAICTKPASLEESLTFGNDFGGWSRKVEACVGRWGIRLAKAPGSIREIGAASLGGCEMAIESQTATWAKEQRARGDTPDPYDQSLKRFRADALEKATFYVAMGKAGNCRAE